MAVAGSKVDFAKYTALRIVYSREMQEGHWISVLESEDFEITSCIECRAMT